MVSPDDVSRSSEPKEAYMKRLTGSLGILMIAGIAVAPVEAGGPDVNIGINIGHPPPPPLVLAAPPPLVVVPGSPVYYAPGVNVNFFAYGGRYYTYHDGGWFVARSHRGPWAFVAAPPQPVLAVPVAYYKVPPGHMKKLHGKPHRKD
jgi:hypothetical protein